jgi:hypothetical protein
MFHQKLDIETSDGHYSLGFSKLVQSGADELTEVIISILPHRAVQKLRLPSSSSVPLVVCTQAQDSGSGSFTKALALFSLCAGGLASTYEDMVADSELMPLTVTCGAQLSEWFIEHVNMYYADEVTRRLHADGEENACYNPDHRVVVPIVEFSAASLSQAYVRLLVAVADLDDSGSGHDEVGHVGAITHDAVWPAGVQFIHLESDKRVSSCFVPFRQFVEDAHRWVMF